MNHWGSASLEIFTPGPEVLRGRSSAGSKGGVGHHPHMGPDQRVPSECQVCEVMGI